MTRREWLLHMAEVILKIPDDVTRTKTVAELFGRGRRIRPQGRGREVRAMKTKIVVSGNKGTPTGTKKKG